jgi:branched-chain amino acid transport system ATP-binding protein
MPDQVSPSLTLLETRSLTKEFGGVAAIKNVSIKVDQNEIVGLIGPNGAGKTTLFNLVSGLESPVTGDILFEGKSILGKKPHSICRLGIARTYQSVRPFLNHTVRENIAVGVTCGRGFGNGERQETKVDEIMETLGLAKKSRVLAKHLTLEERKMVEVGRALGSNPKLVMLDEPMAGLNASEINQFIDLIYEMRKKSITIFVVEHIMKAISSACTRVIVMHSGEVLATGTPAEVLSDEKVINVYLGESYSKPSG